MKVIKIIGEGAERRTYVEGGPACGYHSRVDPSPKCHKGRLITPNGVQVLPHSYKDVGECPACHGTGLIPVEQYSDEQLDAFLNTHFDTWDLRMRRELHTNEPVYSIEGEPWTLNFPCAETSRGAKIAAVIAVTEGEK